MLVRNQFSYMQWCGKLQVLKYVTILFLLLQDRYSSISVVLRIPKSDLPHYYHTVDGKQYLGKATSTS